VVDIPEEVRNELEIKFVTSIEEVLKEALDVDLPEPKLIFNRPEEDKKIELRD
jgi:ATP-dependent Lon protease